MSFKHKMDVETIMKSANGNRTLRRRYLDAETVWQEKKYEWIITKLKKYKFFYSQSQQQRDKKKIIIIIIQVF